MLRPFPTWPGGSSERVSLEVARSDAEWIVWLLERVAEFTPPNDLKSVRRAELLHGALARALGNTDAQSKGEGDA